MRKGKVIWKKGKGMEGEGRRKGRQGGKGKRKREGKWEKNRIGRELEGKREE